MPLAPIPRPYRAVLFGAMTLWAAIGLAAGVAALLGIPGAVIVERRSLYGLAGLWVGVRNGLIIGAMFSIVALVSLWLGQRLLRGRAPRTTPEPLPEGRAAD